MWQSDTWEKANFSGPFFEVNIYRVTKEEEI